MLGGEKIHAFTYCDIALPAAVASQKENQFNKTPRNMHVAHRMKRYPATRFQIRPHAILRSFALEMWDPFRGAKLNCLPLNNFGLPVSKRRMQNSLFTEEVPFLLSQNPNSE